jgi:hypothetical protein
MATKNIDSISVFLETVDEGVRSAKLNGVPAAPPPPPSSGRAAPRTLGLSATARAVLDALRDTPDGEAPVADLQHDLGLGVLEVAGAVKELEDRRVVQVDDEVLKLTAPRP